MCNISALWFLSILMSGVRILLGLIGELIVTWDDYYYFLFQHYNTHTQTYLRVRNWAVPFIHWIKIQHQNMIGLINIVIKNSFSPEPMILNIIVTNNRKTFFSKQFKFKLKWNYYVLEKMINNKFVRFFRDLCYFNKPKKEHRAKWRCMH